MSTGVLLRQCGWLSVHQMIVYFSLVLLHKVITTKKPEYLSQQMKFVTRSRETRNTDGLCLEKRKCKTVTAQRTFIPRTIDLWNSLPFSLRAISDCASFKRSLREQSLYSVIFANRDIQKNCQKQGQNRDMDNSLPKQGQNRDNYKKTSKQGQKQGHNSWSINAEISKKKKLKGDKHVQNNNLSRR